MVGFRFASIVFSAWGVLFLALPRWANEVASRGSVSSGHAEDWTRVVGLFSLAFAALLEAAHRSTDSVLRRTVARVVLVFAIACALLMVFWQLVPERRWFRWDLVNVALLVAVSIAMYPSTRRAR